ncbi:MAG TPA: hypothetical protein PKL85_04710, partial [Bacteroidia bacterium]|nr:hypothetical protein [Bacteroidia bacterium]
MLQVFIVYILEIKYKIQIQNKIQYKSKLNLQWNVEKLRMTECHPRVNVTNLTAKISLNSNSLFLKIREYSF